MLASKRQNWNKIKGIDIRDSVGVVIPSDVSTNRQFSEKRTCQDRAEIPDILGHDSEHSVDIVISMTLQRGNLGGNQV